MLVFASALGAACALFVVFLRLHCRRAENSVMKRVSAPLAQAGAAGGDAPRAANCPLCVHGAAAVMLGAPKYKRDPDINVDDEVISVHPREEYD